MKDKNTISVTKPMSYGLLHPYYASGLSPLLRQLFTLYCILFYKAVESCIYLLSVFWCTGVIKVPGC